MADSLFSVLIANYNNGPYIQKCIKSVIDQSYKNWELIIVDDCSSDNSLSAIKQFSDPRIKLFTNNKNQGCGFSKRKAVELATGSFAGFLDSDDYLATNAIETMVEAHLKNPLSSLIYSTYYLFDEAAQTFSLVEGNKTIPADSTVIARQVVSHFASFKTKKYMLTGGIDASFKRAIDRDLYFKLEEVGDLLFINVPLYYYRVHSTGISQLSHEELALNWNYLAVLSAYRRRKNNNFSKNISSIQAHNLLKHIIKTNILKFRFYFIYKAIRIFYL